MHQDNSLGKTRNPDNAVSRRLGLSDRRTRYHTPYMTAKNIVFEGEKIPYDK